MSRPIDESTAWTLVLALGGRSARAGDEPAAEVVRVPLPERPDAWIEVDPGGGWTASGGVTDAARALLDLYVPVAARPMLVLGQLGQSLDGRIATEGGASHYVTGPEDIRRLHRVRAIVDAVVVGASTVEADDPRLTVREVEGDDPVRVVLDPDARLDPDRRLFHVGGPHTIVVHRAATPAWAPAAGTEELVMPVTEGGGLDLGLLLAALRARGLDRILVEGGGRTVSAFLRADLLDRLHMTVAPMLIGSGRPSITLDPISNLDRALRPACRTFPLGRDVLFDLDLRAGAS